MINEGSQWQRVCYDKLKTKPKHLKNQYLIEPISSIQDRSCGKLLENKFKERLVMKNDKLKVRCFSNQMCNHLLKHTFTVFHEMIQGF